MDWVIKDADEDDRQYITKNLYPTHDFDKLVNKALQMIVLEHGEYTWKESLQQVRVPVSCHMSHNRSKECIQKFFEFNNLDLKVEIKKIEAILDKTTTKVNSILFKGPSNSGKTLICNSLKHSFLSYAELAPGITNNFWLQPAKGKRVMFQDEAQWPEEQQDRLKLITGGQECPFSQKGLPDELLKRTPYIAAFNTWPWARILNQAHIQAFKNRCLIYCVQREDWLQEFSDEGDINPLAWLELMQEFEEEEQLIIAQEEFEGNGEELLMEDFIPVPKVLDYFSEDSTPSYDGYYSSSDEWSAIKEELKEKRPNWKEDHVQAQLQYYKDFDQKHPKYEGWLEDCNWWEELNKDIPDYPTFKQWRKIKRITLQGIDAVKKCVECIDKMVEKDEPEEIYGEDQPDSNIIIEDETPEKKIPEVIQLSSDSMEDVQPPQFKRVKLQSPDYKYDDVQIPDVEESPTLLELDLPVEEDKFSLFLSQDEESTVMGYDVGEFKDHPMIIELITDIEHSYMYNYNTFVPEGLMYYLVKELVQLEKREPAEKLFDDV